jgi:hypothetical protein
MLIKNQIYEAVIVDYTAEGVSVTAVVDDKTYGPLRAFDVAPKKENDDEW